MGLRDAFVDEVIDYADSIDFLEVVPENWMTMGTVEKERFRRLRETFPMVAHGLSLSIGDPNGLDVGHLKRLRAFLDRWEIETYSEHLSFTSLAGEQSHELLPLPMTEKMVDIVVEKIERVQSLLQRPLVLENPTYYLVPESTMSEIDFIGDILSRSDATLLLDINNLFVNGFNHGFDPIEFLDALDMNRVAYCHVAGHLEYREDLYIDTHGAPVKEEVWDLLADSLRRRRVPVLLERDNNIPPMEVLMAEFQTMREVVRRAGGDG